jgi:hypothetical protein
MTAADRIELSDIGVRNRLGASSEWIFTTIAVPNRLGSNGENDCWFQKDGSAVWERIENTDGFWSLFGPLLGIQGRAAPAARRSSAPAQPRSRKWLVLKIVFVMSLLALIAMGVLFRDTIVRSARGLLTPEPATQVSADIEDGLAKAVGGMRADLPKRIDATTTLMWVSYSGTKMIYDNRLELEAAKIDDGTKKKLSQLITVNTCGSPASRKLLDLGGSYRYVYSDIHAKVVMTVDITRDNCS